MSTVLKRNKQNKESLKLVNYSDYFKLITSSEIIVPVNYSNIQDLNSEELSYFKFADLRASFKNYSQPTAQIKSNEKYFVKIFKIEKFVSSEICLQFLKSKNASLVGLHGIILLFRFQKEIFPLGTLTISYDEINNLYKDDNNNPRVPSVLNVNNVSFKLLLGTCGNRLAGQNLICFNK